MSVPPKPTPCQPDRPETLQTGATSWLVHRLEETPSTNDLARAWLAATSPKIETDRPGVWIAARQTAGRGTRNRSWASPEGGLWLSVAMALGGRAEDRLPGLSLRVGLAALRAARHLAGPEIAGDIRIRWPNDLIVASEQPSVRKLGGIVIDQISSWCVIGIGLNVNNPPPSADADGNPLRTRSVTLSEVTGRHIPMAELEIALLRELAALVPVDGLPADLAAELDRTLWMPSSPVTVTGARASEITGRIIGISQRPETLGGLVLSLADSTQTVITSGTVR